MTIRSTTQTTRLLLVRHGESEGNRDRTFTQNPEVPLTPLGRLQARAAGERLARRYRPARIIASPFVRAHQTATIIAEVLGLSVEIDAAFREQSFGVFAGQPYESLLSDASYHEGPRWNWRPEGGESLTDVYERVVPAFERVARGGAGQDVVVVSHGGVMVTLCAFVTGSWEGVAVTPNAGIVIVEHAAGRYTPPALLLDE